MAPNQKLEIYIDDKPFTIADADQEAAALLRLAGRDPKSYDLFVIGKNGVEQKVGDGQIINLRDSSRFSARKKVRFTIDGERFTTYDDDQSAAALLRLAGVNPADYDLARVRPAGESESFSDDQIVTIANGDEFVTAKHVGAVA
jgi:hypothetical protein